MNKFLALISARNKEFYRDRSAMIWTLLFPFVVLCGFTYGYSGKQDPILRLSVYPAKATELPVVRGLMGTPGLEVIATDDQAAARKKLEHYESDLLLGVNDPTHLVYSINQDSDKGRLAERLFLDVVARHPLPRPSHRLEIATGHKIRYSDWLLPGLLAMNIMFGSMFGVGYVIVRYRKNGVLKRLRATPLSAFMFLAAQVASRMLLMIGTSYMVLIGAMILIGFRPAGSWLDLGIFLAISSCAMISLGLVVAARITSEEVADGVLNLMTWPMIFLSGIWFSIEGASSWVLMGAKAMPLKHVVDGLRAILVDGTSLSQLTPQMGILLAMSVVFVFVGSLIFRWR
jgi:ABC-type multidrug transport system permease subunit